MYIIMMGVFWFATPPPCLMDSRFLLFRTHSFEKRPVKRRFYRYVAYVYTCAHHAADKLTPPSSPAASFFKSPSQSSSRRSSALGCARKSLTRFTSHSNAPPTSSSPPSPPQRPSTRSMTAGALSTSTSPKYPIPLHVRSFTPQKQKITPSSLGEAAAVDSHAVPQRPVGHFGVGLAEMNGVRPRAEAALGVSAIAAAAAVNVRPTSAQVPPVGALRLPPVGAPPMAVVAPPMAVGAPPLAEGAPPLAATAAARSTDSEVAMQPRPPTNPPAQRPGGGKALPPLRGGVVR